FKCESCAKAARPGNPRRCRGTVFADSLESLFPLRVANRVEAGEKILHLSRSVRVSDEQITNRNSGMGCPELFPRTPFQHMMDIRPSHSLGCRWLALEFVPVHLHVFSV